jgi:hypothetical protein
VGGITGSRRVRRRITWLAALGAAAGAIAVLVLVLPNHGGDTTVAPTADSPRQHIEVQQKRLEKLPAQARTVAGEFLLTALARKHLDQAWKLAGPEVREGLTHKEWMTGNIAVPVADGGVGDTRMGVDSVTADEVWLRVLVSPARAGKQFRPMVYSVRLNRVGGHWLVNELQPRVGVAIKRVD